MSDKRTDVLLVTPLPPMETGLATFAERILRHTGTAYRWTVAHSGKADTDALPTGPRYVHIDELATMELPAVRIFQLGNSVHCFPVVQALYSYGGTAVFHETVIHHMLRHCYLEADRLEDYRRELRFCLGPAAEGAEQLLYRSGIDDAEYDALLKSYPLAGRAVNASHSAACLSEYAASTIRGGYPPGAVMTIGHPLSPLPDIPSTGKPFPVCIGMVGAYHPGRNLDAVLSATMEIRRKNEDAGLLLIGGGYPEDLPEWVISTGRLPEPLYQSWIRTLDCVMDLRHPTCGETSGSLLEAMRAGVPPIVSASGSFLNLPSDGVIRVPPDNLVKGSLAAFDLLIRDPGQRQSISKRARRHALETGSVSRLRSDWERLVSLSSRFSGSICPEGKRPSISPAWMEPPEGFRRNTGTGPVTWSFEGTVLLEGPPDSSEALVTAWGRGTVNGVGLPDEASVLEVRGRLLEFRGKGWLSDVLWS